MSVPSFFPSTEDNGESSLEDLSSELEASSRALVPEAEAIAHLIYFGLLWLRATYAEVVERNDILAQEGGTGRLAPGRRKAYDVFDAEAAAVVGGGGVDDLRSCEPLLGRFLDPFAHAWPKARAVPFFTNRVGALPAPCRAELTPPTMKRRRCWQFLFCSTRNVELFDRVFKPLFVAIFTTDKLGYCY